MNRVYPRGKTAPARGQITRPELLGWHLLRLGTSFGSHLFRASQGDIRRSRSPAVAASERSNVQRPHLRTIAEARRWTSTQPSPRLQSRRPVTSSSTSASATRGARGSRLRSAITASRRGPSPPSTSSPRTQGWRRTSSASRSSPRATARMLPRKNSTQTEVSTSLTEPVSANRQLAYAALSPLESLHAARRGGGAPLGRPAPSGPGAPPPSSWVRP